MYPFPSQDSIKEFSISLFFGWTQVPQIYKEMEASGCTPDRKARQLLQTALTVLEQKQCKFEIKITSMLLLLSSEMYVRGAIVVTNPLVIDPSLFAV